MLKIEIVFAAISPHPPILLPNIGSEEDRKKVKKTIASLTILGQRLKESSPHLIIISSPHPDWGFNVPLYFLAQDFKGEIKSYLIGLESPKFYFEKGKEIYHSLIQLNKSLKISLIASGDLSHCLKANGPYGFHPDGPKFDKSFIESLTKKDLEKILTLDKLYPEAGECGLRSFCFLLGILESYSIASEQIWQSKILSYQAPFGVGYLVAEFKFLKAQ